MLVREWWGIIKELFHFHRFKIKTSVALGHILQNKITNDAPSLEFNDL